jgi:hypothetical protein
VVKLENQAFATNATHGNSNLISERLERLQLNFSAKKKTGNRAN